MNAAQQVIHLVAKDLRIEARSRQTVGLVIVLGVLVVVVLALGLGPGPRIEGMHATAILWVAYLFGGALCFEKTMAVESHDGALGGLLLAPIDRGTIYIGKLVANVALMLAVALVVTPVGVLLFRFDLSSAPLGFVLVMGLSMLGFAAVGTLFAAAVTSSRLQGGLLAILVFPLSLPLVIASTQLMLRLFEEGQSLLSGGLGLLIAFDVIFIVASWLVFEFLLEP
ncbi:MAG: heme exporter protein CcmB [Phycisphaerales bacterium JB039]